MLTVKFLQCLAGLLSKERRLKNFMEKIAAVIKGSDRKRGFMRYIQQNKFWFIAAVIFLMLLGLHYRKGPVSSPLAEKNNIEVTQTKVDDGRDLSRTGKLFLVCMSLSAIGGIVFGFYLAGLVHKTKFTRALEQYDQHFEKVLQNVKDGKRAVFNGREI